jgi:hypothetical protein
MAVQMGHPAPLDMSEARAQQLAVTQNDFHPAQTVGSGRHVAHATFERIADNTGLIG